MKKNSPRLPVLFETHLRDRRFFKPRDRILVACSGGPDSVALFHLLHALAPEHGWTLGLVHYDHQLRPVSKKDALFVRTLAQKAGVPFYLGTGNVAREARKTKSSTEECARAMRYGFFLKTAGTKKFSKIVLAHTRDDQAETVLMRMLQGTGLRGLSGIRESVRMKGVTLLRPLLVFTKKELLAYLSERLVRYCSDESNAAFRFVRNRIRLDLIPKLQQEFNPRVVEALARLPSIVSEENALLSELEKIAWGKVFKCRARHRLDLRRSVFLKYPAPLQFRMIEKALKRLDGQSGLSFEAWERLRGNLRKNRYRCSLPKDIDLALTPKNVTIYKKHARE